MKRSPKALDVESEESRDRKLDEALEMTFPASDPVAIVAPGSTSRHQDPPVTRGRAPAEPAQRAPLGSTR